MCACSEIARKIAFWFRWSGDDIDPLESFAIVNGHVDSKDALVKKKIGDINYGLYRVEATIYRNFDLSRYPLDNQTLKIQIEDTKSKGMELAFRPDKANAGVSQKISIPGWRIEKIDSYSSITKYPSNYGDISLPNNAESVVPRYTFAVDISRGGYGNFIKLFSMLFLSGLYLHVQYFRWRRRDKGQQAFLTGGDFPGGQLCGGHLHYHGFLLTLLATRKYFVLTGEP